MKVNPEQRERYWQEQVDLWKESGVSKVKFCHGKDYPAHKLVYWDRRFRGLLKLRHSASGFSLVKLPAVQVPDSLKISLGNGVSIEGLCALSMKELGELVKALVPLR